CSTSRLGRVASRGTGFGIALARRRRPVALGRLALGPGRQRFEPALHAIKQPRQVRVALARQRGGLFSAAGRVAEFLGRAFKARPNRVAALLGRFVNQPGTLLLLLIQLVARYEFLHIARPLVILRR